MVSSDSDSDPGAAALTEPGSDQVMTRSTEPDTDLAPVNEQVIEQRLQFLTEAFPDTDVMELQDTLARHRWCLQSAVESLSSPPLLPNTLPPPPASRVPQAATVDDDDGQLQAPAKRRRLRMYDSDSDEDIKSFRPTHKSGQRKSPAVSRAPVREKSCKSSRASDDDEPDFDQQKLVYMSESDDSDDEYGGARGVGGRMSDGSDIYDSALTTLRDRVVSFLNTASIEELVCMSGCSRKKAELVTTHRPFNGWLHTVSCFKSVKTLAPDMLNSALEVLRMRASLDHLLRQCEKIAHRLKARVTSLIDESNTSDFITKQPAILVSSRTLSHYQMIGLSWLVLMYKERINAILADEMGLGKTIQAISFLAYLKMENPDWKHLIVVPSSILDNWLLELSAWCPELRVVAYRGTLEERRNVRIQLVRGDPDAWDVVVTTYNLVASSPEDKGLFRNLSFKYIVFDEAHMLKNMMSKRYSNLTRLRGEHRLLLTGTPLQNNLLELASLLLFVMPNVFATARGSLSTIFDVIPKTSGDKRSQFECARIEEARRIMAPFFLRRLKHHVLRDLPEKCERVERVDMTSEQAERYRALSSLLVKQKPSGDSDGSEVSQSAVGVIMSMRKLSNHPLLLRYHYDEDKLRQIARAFVRIPNHEHKEEQLVMEDLSVMSDFEIHTTCGNFEKLHQFRLEQRHILSSGKFGALDRILPQLYTGGHRVLVFSQFVIMLDVMEVYLKARGHRYRRLDGQTPVADRQRLIDEYNKDPSIFVFLLSTRAGGLGINLTSADRVIIHDVDYNPQNDRQAEDRCHRIGQSRPVEIIKLICRGSIDECMLKIAQDKLRLAHDLSSNNADTDNGQGDNSENSHRPEDVRKLLELVLQES